MAAISRPQSRVRSVSKQSFESFAAGVRIDRSSIRRSTPIAISSRRNFPMFPKTTKRNPLRTGLAIVIDPAMDVVSLGMKTTQQATDLRPLAQLSCSPERQRPDPLVSPYYLFSIGLELLSSMDRV